MQIEITLNLTFIHFQTNPDPKNYPITSQTRFENVWKRSWADNEVGGWFGPGASWTLTSFSWLSFIFNIECDNAVAANHDVVGSGENSAPHKSCPAVTPPADGASEGNNVSTSSDCASGFLWSQHAVQYKTANLSERGCFEGSIGPSTPGTKVCLELQIQPKIH